MEILSFKFSLIIGVYSFPSFLFLFSFFMLLVDYYTIKILNISDMTKHIQT